MHPAAAIDQAIGPLDQSREDVWSQRVDGKRLCVTLGSCSATTLEIDARIVNDRVHAPDLVDLLRHCFRRIGATQIAYHQARRLRLQIPHSINTLRSPRVKNDGMPFRHERTRSRETESVGGASDEDALHGTPM